MPSPPPAQPVPDTGVTKCYNNTVEIPCPAPGQDFYGQDASYTINPMSYTKLDASGNDLPESATSWAMVRDNVTGLIWEVKTEANQNDTYTWDDAHTYAADLRLGGHSDWRLPTIKELQYLVDFSIPYPGPAIDTRFFPNTASSWYWSSTTYAYSTSYAWVVDFSYGYDGYGGKTNSFYVRAVREGQSGSFGSLVISIEPAEARTAGAQWRRTGTTPWLNSGTTESNVPTGSHTVEFKKISGWTKPANRSITVSAGQTATATGSYTAIAQTGSILPGVLMLLLEDD